MRRLSRRVVPLADPASALVAEQEGFVSFVVDRHAIALEVASTLISEGREITDFGVKMTVEIFEATLIRMIGLLRVSEVPFSDHRRLIARASEGFG